MKKFELGDNATYVLGLLISVALIIALTIWGK